jgi:hypothetical protein
MHWRVGRESANLREHEAWEPEWIDGRFACLLECVCGETVAALGTQSVEGQYSEAPEDPTIDYGDEFKVLLFQPPLPLIRVPENTPPTVRDEVISSFRLFWLDSEGCGNRIRSTVERLLTWAGVKRSTIGFKRRRVPLSLHSRIELFGKREPQVAEQLMAIKWVGNAGSHVDPITRNDLLDGYEMLEYVFEELFTERTKKMVRIAREINRAKKPRSASRRAYGPDD